ncbi:MAG: hypothetical protein IKI22_04780 [Neisseriaceae bacterium]|nr:hypothetical protein [Neisseriaceae bacterium]
MAFVWQECLPYGTINHSCFNMNFVSELNINKTLPESILLKFSGSVY